MIKPLTRNPLFLTLKRLTGPVVERLQGMGAWRDKGGLVLKLFLGCFLLGLGMLFVGRALDYRDAAEIDGSEALDRVFGTLPSVIPLIFEGLGFVLALVAFLVSLWVRPRSSPDRRRILVGVALAIAAVAALAAWLPTDVIETRAAILGKAPAGETPSIPAYLGMIFLVSLLILSIPVAALVYFRLSLMDRYVVHNFLSPFALCLFSFMAIWVLADLSDEGEILASLPFGKVLTFYVVQVPYMILFVLPIAVLLSGLYALSRMSKANEFISMIGAGRSVPRILAPLFITGAYISLVGLAFKYQWGPAAVGYKEAVIQTAQREQWAKRHGGTGRPANSLWASRGWMHMNEAGRRSWFVGGVPLKLSDEMGDVAVIQLDELDQPVRAWIARRAKWVWDADPPKWILSRVRVYTYNEDRIPTIESHDRLELTDWNETPWKVLSSSQNPDHLGIPGLTMYLNANRELDRNSLAPFRTNRWFIFAEPLSCFAMILVAAPLGIVYSRRGVMGGVTAAICIFALMYLLQNTFLAMGHSGRMSPFVAAWLTNALVAATGLVLLHFRSRNREIPKPKDLFATLFRRRSPVPAKPLPAPIHS